MLLGKIYRFFDEIRRPQGALLGVRQMHAELASSAHRLARNPVHYQRLRTRNPASTRNGCRVEIACNLYEPYLYS